MKLKPKRKWEPRTNTETEPVAQTIAEAKSELEIAEREVEAGAEVPIKIESPKETVNLLFHLTLSNILSNICKTFFI